MEVKRLSQFESNYHMIVDPSRYVIARLEFRRRLYKDVEVHEAFEQHVREEKEHRRAVREVPVLSSLLRGMKLMGIQLS
ncbi:hypothetical protein K2173_018742 [Erythroxylum novogranatense]|uniref:Uncharacterized protein n=1 Tax=Erythroxylum novogranatense TaxID=1862640 RepID=A0AAV8SAN1_9ROSI|nr:hypothetical protein K2173_018742 [Erythroxylum novogranatense]